MGDGGCGGLLSSKPKKGGPSSFDFCVVNKRERKRGRRASGGGGACEKDRSKRGCCCCCCCCCCAFLSILACLLACFFFCRFEFFLRTDRKSNFSRSTTFGLPFRRKKRLHPKRNPSSPTSLFVCFCFSNGNKSLPLSP